jgi:D-3-phosphoglycerate dehydrogenase
VSHKILIADSLAPAGTGYLQAQQDVEVKTATGLAGPALAEAIAQHDGVVVRSGVQITAEVIERCMSDRKARLKGIARAGVGVDNIDLDAATRYGIAVMNSASASTITTAEHAFALMIALARNIAPAHAAMAAGGWDRNTFTGLQLHGRTLGIVGFGRIGQALAQRALAFGLNVLAFDPLINAEAGLDGQVPLLSSFDDLIRRVDIVSFHVPRTEATANMLGAAQFAAAKKGLLVVNAARGGIIDESALLEALASGRCAGAAIDVFEPEPPPKDSPLRGHPKVLTTPHLGASTIEAQEAVSVDACKALLTFLRGEGVAGLVNAAGLNLDLSERQKKFVDLAARMVALLHTAAPEPGLKSVKVTVRGPTIAARAETLSRFALASLLQRHLDQPVNIINASLIAGQRGISVQSVVGSDKGDDRLLIETAPRGHRVEGAMYGDALPRITNLDGYAMDMVPAGHMVLLTNADQPGRIGLVGQKFGDANVNIAEMVIGRKLDAEGRTIAMMILKVDEPPPAYLLNSLRTAKGILSIAEVTLPVT